MNYFYIYMGYITFGASALGVLILTLLKYRGSENFLIRQFCFISLYTVFSISVFLLTREAIPYILDKEQEGKPVSDTFQLVLLILSLNLFLQFFLIQNLKSTISVIQLLGLVNIISCVSTFLFINFGIINLTWYVIFTGTFGGFLLATEFYHTLAEMTVEIQTNFGEKYDESRLDLIREEANRLIKMGLQTYLALAASLGVSMSILFKDGRAAWLEPELLGHAIRMVVAFGMLSIGVLLWIVKPYWSMYARIIHLYRSKQSKIVVVKK